MILTIDPGLRGCGVAVFDDRKLQWAGYSKNPVLGRGYVAHANLGEVVRHDFAKHFPFTPTLVIIEHPVCYPGMPQTDMNDLLDVVAVGASVACQFQTVIKTVFPSEWKGQVKKSVMLERIMGKLTEDEKANVAWTNKSDNEDILDAIGIGLWQFKRLNTKQYPGATP